MKVRTSLYPLVILGLGAYIGLEVHQNRKVEKGIQSQATDLSVSTSTIKILQLQDFDHDGAYSERELQATENLAKELKTAATKIRLNKQQ